MRSESHHLEEVDRAGYENARVASQSYLFLNLGLILHMCRCPATKVAVLHCSYFSVDPFLVTMSPQNSSASIPLEAILSRMNADLTLGVILIFGLLATMLYGITSVQTFIYFTNDPRDGKYLKITVVVLWILDTLETMLLSHVVYTYCIKALSNPGIWTQIGWTDAAHFMLMTLSDSMITIIFVHRIWRLERKVWSLIAIIPPAALVFIGGQVIGIFVLVITDFEEVRHRIAWLYYTVFALQAFSDIAIMVSLCIALLKRRSKIRRSHSVIGMLILFSVNTCVLTSSVGLAALLTNALSPGTLFWQGLDGVLPKLMLNSLLALLNSRELIRNKGGSDAPVSIHLSRLDASGSGPTRTTTTIDIKAENSHSSNPDQLDSDNRTDVKISNNELDGSRIIQAQKI
ncbi:hypothetical protein BDY19DRAFT_538570 [Irpex rosettiformis]|uniref:Uncharacterized protein n=1 Tax=Irpex rosettiformis TaxID=378272 RepID=A0ACB8TR59_9APHY|nr:hypothetical protein BDY19DRAFT_538570 [Irpex rosettiformis]